jgi:hypothetical protein
MSDDATTREDLHLLYQVSTADLEYFKRQQWNVTNYALLLYAGMIGIVTLLGGSVGGGERLLLCSAATVTAVAAFYILKVLNNSIDVRKARLEAVRERLSQPFRDAWAVGTKPEEALSVYRLLLVVVATGACVVWWLVYFRL